MSGDGVSTCTSTAYLQTERPQRYLKQLLSHLGNRIETQLPDEEHGSVRMEHATCDLSADVGGITMVATAADADSLARMQDVVARHLVRFTGAEALTTDWS